MCLSLKEGYTELHCNENGPRYALVLLLLTLGQPGFAPLLELLLVK